MHRWLRVTFVLLLVPGPSTSVTKKDDQRPQDAVQVHKEPAFSLERVIPLSNSLKTSGKKFLERLTGTGNVPPVKRPYAVAWIDKELILTDPGTGRILRISKSGRLRSQNRSDFISPIGVAVCEDRIYVSDSRLDGVALLDPKLRLVQWVVEGRSRPTGIACQGDRLWVVETGEHRILELRGAHVANTIGKRGAGTGEFNFPTSISFHQGSLWVIDTLNFRVQQFAADSGAYLSDFGQLGDSAGELPRAKGISVDLRGRLWVSDAHLNQIAIFGQDGTYLTSFSSTDSGAGSLSFPTGIATSAGGEIAIVDSLNRRVLVLRMIDHDQ